MDHNALIDKASNYTLVFQLITKIYTVELV